MSDFIHPEIVPGFLVFGSDSFIQQVDEGHKNGTLMIKRSAVSDFASGQLSLNNQMKGSVWMNVDTENPYFYVYEDEKQEKGSFPWNYKQPHFDYNFKLSPSEDSLENFKDFTGFMLGFEGFVRNLIKEKFNVEMKGDLLPQGFFGILDYEFFRQIYQLSKHIEAGVAVPTCFGNKKAIFLMLRVVADEEKNDIIEISDLVEVV